jgi:hypothetical protein
MIFSEAMNFTLAFAAGFIGYSLAYGALSYFFPDKKEGGA